MDNPAKPAVAIFADHLLYASNTFILTQAEAMTRVTPWYVGTRLIRELPPPQERTIVLNRGGLTGRIEEVAYKALGVSPRMKRRVAQIRPLVVHAHFGPGGVRAMPLARDVGAPLIVTFHGDDAALSDAGARASNYSLRAYLRNREDLAKVAIKIVAVSAFIGKELIRQGFPPENIYLHYIGVDTSVLQADTTVTRLPVVLFVGRLVEKKGCEYLIKAMAGVQRQVPRSALLVIGDGPLRSTLEAQAHGILQNCTFLGRQTHESVRRQMNHASVLAVPSIRTSSGSAEGLPTVIPEALALNLPVVATTSAGIPEIITDGENGFLVPERNSAVLEKRIVTLLTDSHKWHHFSLAGRRRVETDFNVQKQSALLEELYFDISASRPVESRVPVAPIEYIS